MNKKPHISPSQVASYTRCGEAYRRRYIENEIIPPAISLSKGVAVHKGAQYNFEQKVESHHDLKSDDIIDKSVSEFEKTVETQGLTLSPEEESRGKALVVGEAKDSTRDLAGLFAREVAPKYQPKAVEEEVYTELPSSSHNLKGYIDLTTVDNKIVDLKTSAKKWNQERVDTDFQFTFYALNYRAKNKKDPKGIIVENLVDSGKSLKSVTFESRRGDADYDAAINRLNRVLEGINAGIYPPANDGAWWCDARYCGYFMTCKFVKH